METVGAMSLGLEAPEGIQAACSLRNMLIMIGPKMKFTHFFLPVTDLALYTDLEYTKRGLQWLTSA
jgi:hypothetical protein